MNTDTFPEIPDLVWGESLVTGDGRMDETHEEFVTQLARLRAARLMRLRFHGGERCCSRCRAGR